MGVYPAAHTPNTQYIQSAPPPPTPRPFLPFVTWMFLFEPFNKRGVELFMCFVNESPFCQNFCQKEGSCDIPFKNSLFLCDYQTKFYDHKPC